MLSSTHDTTIYPESDGKPMAETDTHRDLILLMIDLLRQAFPDAYVSGNICLYYEEGNPKKMISPDALLCRGQRPQKKRIYRAWEENAQLDLVVEFSSRSTRREDHHKKKRIYQEILRVPYYVIFDPHALYVNAFELQEGEYVTLEINEEFRWNLEDLGVQLAVGQETGVRLYDQEGVLIPTRAERAEVRAEAESLRAQEAEARAETETRRVEAESLRAQEAEARAEAEAQPARKMETELLALRQQLTVLQAASSAKS